MVYVKAPDGRIISYENLEMAKEEIAKASAKYGWKESDFSISESGGDESFKKFEPPKTGADAKKNAEELREEARLLGIQAAHPEISAYFPSSVRNSGKGKGARAQAAIEDVLSLPGRGWAAGLDAIFNARDGEGFGEAYTRSMGLERHEKNGRSAAGDFAQGMLRDPLTLPTTAIPVGKIPWLAEMGAGMAGKAGALARNLGKPAIEGAATGLAAETLRPAITTEEFDIDNLIEGAILGGALGVGGHHALGGSKKLTGKAYDELLAKLSLKNKAKPEFLDAASSPGALEKMKKNYRTEAEIADDLLKYRHFDEEKFPENEIFKEFLERSQSKVTPEDVVENLTGYRKRKLKERNGGGLFTMEEAIAGRLPKEAEPFYRQMPAKEAEKREVLELSAKEINERRQGLGKLLDDDFKRETMGRPDEEVKVLKDAYFGLRKHLMDIAENEGETAAAAAYAKMGDKLKAREALFDALGVSSNKYKAADNLTGKLNTHTFGNPRRTELREQFRNFDDIFGTDFGERIKWKDIANNLGIGDNALDFRVKGDNNWFTGKGFRGPIDRLGSRWTGGTIDDALKMLGKAKEARGTPSLYGNPLPSHEKTQSAGLETLAEAQRRGIEMADSLGYKPGTKAYADTVSDFVKSYMYGEHVPTEVVGTSTQKRGER